MQQDSDSPEMINKCLSCVRIECINCHSFTLKSMKSELDNEQAERLYKSGLTDLEIARRLNCHRHTVYRWRTRNEYQAIPKARML